MALPTSQDAYVTPWSRADGLCLGAIVLWGIALLAPNLGHVSIHNWDEAMHQAVARGTYDTFFFPHLYKDPLYAADPAQWWSASVWLLKPAGSFWFGAAMMHLLGVTTLALRLASLFGQLGAAVGLFLLARSGAGRLWATLAALGFLALPFGWVLTQGHFFGDVTDCTLVGWVTLSMVLMLWSIERDSWKWAAAAGAAVGVAYLCKTVLALAPLGVAFALWLCGRTGFCAGPRLRSLLAMVAVALAVAVPWNLYAALTWPEVFRANTRIVTTHISADHTEDVAPWARPADAILNEMNAAELRPLPVALGALVALWLVLRALRRREFVVVGVALWLVSTWATHSFVTAKAPGHVWNAMPAVFVGLALIANDVWRAAPLAAATLATLATPLALGRLHFLTRFRQALPGALEQTRTMPGLAEGLMLAALAASVVGVLEESPRLRRTLSPALALAASLALAWAFLVQAPGALLSGARKKYPRTLISHTRELGLALDRLVPERSVLWQPLDRDPEDQFEVQNLMFWSGRMTYRKSPDLALARQRGYRSYLISPAAERFKPVDGIPAHAWLRAYDAEVPAPPAPLPAGVQPLNVELDGLTIVGVASGEIDGRSDRYALYVKPRHVPTSLRVAFLTAAGEVEQVVTPEASLRARATLVEVAWVIYPVVGPTRSRVQALELGGKRVALP